MLDLVETSIARGGWSHRRLDGTMSQQRRESALKVRANLSSVSSTHLCSSPTEVQIIGRFGAALSRFARPRRHHMDVQKLGPEGTRHQDVYADGMNVKLGGHNPNPDSWRLNGATPEFWLDSQIL